MAIHYIDIHTHNRKEGVFSLLSYSIGRDDIPADPEYPFSAGIHPWDAAILSDTEIESAKEYLMTAPLSAIGEAGLDYIKGGDRDKQQEILRMQLDIASQRELPVIIHCVKAYNDLFSILKDYPALDVILHGYTGSPQQTAQALEPGFYISTGRVSLKSPKTVKSIEATPPERLFIETDDSDISIEYLYNKIAGIKGLGTEALAAAIEHNFKRIFRTDHK